MSNTTQLNSNENKNKSNKKFAIFITSYNYAEYISQAIESVINQSDPDWHLYIIDDCSTDNTYEVVKKYLEKDKRISWKKHQKNIGSVPTIIEGFSEIDADYISTLCSDDWLEPNFVADAKAAFEKHPEIPFCVLGWSACMSFPEKNKTIVQRFKTPFPEKFCGKIYLSPYLVFKNFINIDFIVFQKSCLIEVINELESLKLRQLLEPFLMKRLESLFGAGYMNDNENHGYWRRHIKQITEKNIFSFQDTIEKFSEPLFSCSINKNSIKTISNLATNFINMVSCIGHRKVPYKIAIDWILSDLGKPFAERFGNLDFKFIKENNLEKSLICLAICVWSSFILNSGDCGWENEIDLAKQQLGEWIIETQKKYNIKNIREMYRYANELYDGYFMPLIK